MPGAKIGQRKLPRLFLYFNRYFSYCNLSFFVLLCRPLACRRRISQLTRSAWNNGRSAANRSVRPLLWRRPITHHHSGMTIVGNHRCVAGIRCVFMKQDGLCRDLGRPIMLHSAAGIGTMVADYCPTAMVAASSVGPKTTVGCYIFCVIILVSFVVICCLQNSTSRAERTIQIPIRRIRATCTVIYLFSHSYLSFPLTTTTQPYNETYVDCNQHGLSLIHI